MARPAGVPDPRAPTYVQIADALAERIARRRPGAAVESENELASLFHVNRLTARAALGELERRYAVRRAKGRGTFVARRVEYRIGPDRPPSWTETVREAGARPRTENERVRSVRPPLWARRELGLRAGDRALLVERRRWVDDELATWATSYLPPDVVPGFEREMGRESALYQVLTRVYGLEPRRAWSRCEFEVASEAVAARLGLRGRDHVSVVHGRLDCARLGVPVEVGVAYNRMDVLNIIYEFGASTASTASAAGGAE